MNRPIINIAGEVAVLLKNMKAHPTIITALFHNSADFLNIEIKILHMYTSLNLDVTLSVEDLFT